MSDQASAFVTAFRAALRQSPRYWLPVTAEPMSRRVQAYMLADVERALVIAARDVGLPDDVVDAPGAERMREGVR